MSTIVSARRRLSLVLGNLTWRDAVRAVLLLSVVALAVLTMSACGPAPAAADPYAEFQRLAPSGAPQLSREDAQTRAFLGCGQTFAPGTVDAALAQAYRPGVCA